MFLTLVFPHDYMVEETELPSTDGGIKHLFFPGATQRGGTSGILIRVTPYANKEWIGTFARGYSSPAGVSGVFSCPSPKSLCVVSAGQGYIVQVDSPDNWDMVQASPITDVRIIFDQGLIIFANFTEIYAYGMEGLLWTTQRLCSDELKIKSISSDIIYGTGWDALTNAMTDFRISVYSGRLLS